MKVLITGISGTIGRGVARRLLLQDYEVVGLDRRMWEDPLPGVNVYRKDLRKRPAEDVFREHRPDIIIHMATTAAVAGNRDERFRINLHGTKKVFEFAERYGAKHVVFVSRHTVYGASAQTSLYHREDSAPLGGATFPELADLVAADL